MIDPFNDEYFMKQALIEARAAAEEGEVSRRRRYRMQQPDHSPRPQSDGTSERSDCPCRDAGNNSGSRRLRSQVLDRM